MKDDKLISIITAAYNAELTISECISSVIMQSYAFWELIIVNDGSQDDTLKVINSFNESRIVLINQSNQGVSSARNNGLDIMNGDYFCFLDADDVFTPNSLESRLNVFQKSSDITFVDGVVEHRDLKTNKLLNKFTPTFKGNPYKELLQLNSNCFCGQTWMIKRDFNRKYKFNEGQTHGEDLNLFLELSSNGEKYDFSSDVIMQYRRHSNSAMSNLEGLGNFYLGHLSKSFLLLKEGTLTNDEYFRLKSKVCSIMFRSHLKQFQVKKSLIWLLKKYTK